MKILMTSDNFLPEMGGGQIHVQKIIHNLRKLGVKVSLLTNTLGKDVIDEEVKTVRIPWSKFNFFKIFKKLYQLSYGCQLIHCHYCYRLAMIACLVGKLRRIPVVVTLHGMGILDPSTNTPKFYRLAHSFYRYISLISSDLIISTSQDLADVAYRYIPINKVNIISNGYDSEVFNTTIKIPDNLLLKYKNKKIILTVRRLVPKNGIHYLIEAMPEILRRESDALLLVIGPGRMRSYLENRIRSLKIEQAVILLGEIANDEIPNYLQLADVVVFPSTAESSSIACVEAMAMGKKIVASRLGGLVELLGENEERGTLVDLVEWRGSNYDAPLNLSKEKYLNLAKAVVDNLQTTDFVKAEIAKMYAQSNLSWLIISQKTKEVYEKVVKSK